jgi:hypothetical protein
MNSLKSFLALLTIVVMNPGPVAANDQADRENSYYELQTYEFPEDLKLEISGMARLPNGDLAIALRKGEIWTISNAYNPKKAQYKPFATGLHEPLGLAYRDGSFYTVQRTELTRIADRDHDGTADEFMTVAKGWGVSGSYHEYAYGPQFDHDGNAWITLNCNIGKGPNMSDNKFRGWSFMVTPEGQMSPMSGGFRSPSGIGMNLAGDIFATDQQGNWFPTCPLVHVKKGAFHGHADSLKFTELPGATFKIDGKLPSGLTVAQAAKKVGPYQLPAVWFPYRKVGMSSTDVLCDTTKGGFGPFPGQLFVGEFTMSFVSRVFLEKVKGQYQGACFRFREGLQCAALRMEWGKDGSMFVGQSNRGWNSLGTRSYGLQRIVWNRKMPFEIKTMEARKDGFRLTFTKPVNAVVAKNPKNYSFISYTYKYHSSYGSEEVDTKTLKVTSAKTAKDGLSVDLKVAGLREGYVHELDVTKLKGKDGRPLLHAQAYYTLNRIP